MSKEAVKALNRKRGAVKAQLTRIKDFMNNPDEKDKTHLESKLDTLKTLRIKLSDIRDEYYEVVADDMKRNNLCINCFNSSHKEALCKSSRNCSNCSKRHNSLLSRNFERNVDSQKSPGSETLPNMEPRITTPTLNVNSECLQPKQTVESFENGGEFVGHSKGHSTMFLSSAVVYCQNCRGEVFPLRALLDSGSQSDLINHETALALGLNIKRFGEIENCPDFEIPTMSREEKLCAVHFTSTYDRDETGRFIVKMPLSKDPSCLGDSKQMALRRLQTDSSIVLTWIKKPLAQLKTFVRNRVSIIQKLTESDFWKHMNSENIPADIFSRGISPDKIQHCELWWFGPPFLHQYKELEPYDITAVEGDDLFLQELKETSDFPLCSLLKNLEPLDIISNCSSFTKLQRVIACCKRFIENARHPMRRTMGPLRSAEATLANIRNSFRIPFVRNVVRKILRKCITCRKVNAKDSQQLMADLPVPRATPCRIFSQVVPFEAVLNSRPICPLPNDSNDVDTLTPAHFLVGSSLVAVPDPDYTEIPMNTD
ncbi:uncharacterized protein TNCV_2051331 [Trichonephila clavipes]|nr:uncharacterized protein TNCV_2051331 [Trichonephila clavipes]